MTATVASVPSPTLAVSAGLHVVVGLVVAFAFTVPPLDGAVELPDVEMVELAAAAAAPPIDPAAIENAEPPPPVDLQPPDMQAAIPLPPEPPPPPDAISLVPPRLTLPPPETPPPPPRFDPPPRPPVPRPVARPVTPPAAKPAPADALAGPAPTGPPAVAGPAPGAVPAPPRAAASGPPDPAYVQRLLGALERQREYPRAAREQGDQGRATLRLAIAASGALLEARIERTSGHDSLDEAALRMARRAAPFPPLPASLGADRATFIVPIVFALR